MSFPLKDAINSAKRLNALADMGLKYNHDPYDEERYQEIKELSIQLMSNLSNVPVDEIVPFYKPSIDYPTPKVDIRGLVLNENMEVLMVREKVDGKWSIPGGWADIGYTPSEVVIKEIKEETGLEVVVDRLLAVYDKKCHDHPPQPYYVYKMIFFCHQSGGKLTSSFDILDVRYFSVNNLPPLSKDRILEEQIRKLVGLIRSGSNEVFCD